MPHKYHFLRSDMTSGRGNERPWDIGETREIPEEQKGWIELCVFGYHASPTPWDAFKYAPGPVGCLVKVGEPIVCEKDKAVYAARTLVAAVNVSRELQLFAADCAERVLPLFELIYPNDGRVRHAIEVTRSSADASDLTAAWKAARAAADDSRDIIAWYVARAAAWAAAQDAPWDTAWFAARAVKIARGESAAPAQNVAWDKEEKWQRRLFNKRIGVMISG